MQVKVYFQITTLSLQYVDRSSPEQMLKDLLAHLSVSTHQFGDYVQLGEALIDVELDTTNIVDKAVAALRVKQAEIRAKAALECTQVDKQINALLVIENNPSKPWASDDGEPLLFGDFP